MIIICISVKICYNKVSMINGLLKRGHYLIEEDKFGEIRIK